VLLIEDGSSDGSLGFAKRSPMRAIASGYCSIPIAEIAALAQAEIWASARVDASILRFLTQMISFSRIGSQLLVGYSREMLNSKGYTRRWDCSLMIWLARRAGLRCGITQGSRQ